MNIIWTILIGFVVGLVARFVMPGRDPAGFLITTALGVIGAVVAKFIGQAVGWYRPEEGIGFFASVMGALLVLFIYNKVRGARSAAT